jgi:predicted branched-subunit amino acid permease
MARTPSYSASLMRPIVRDALGIGVATGAYGLSFGALAVAAGLSLPQACALSLLMFTGASQFAFVGLIGGGAAAAVATALLLGARNALYGLRLAPHLRPRPLAAHLVIDESAAMAVRDTPADTRLGFWSTGAAVFAFWNLATLLGALAGQALSDPRALGLDAAAPAAFLALLAPRLREREPQTIAVLAAVAALISVPLVPAGTPVLVAAAVAMVAALARRGEGGAEPARHGIEPARGGA